MKKIKSALFMVALCATLAMLTSCGNNKKTKYTYAPLWDNTISEKDTTGIVGHIFVVTNKTPMMDSANSTLETKGYIYFSENGLIINGTNVTLNGGDSDDEEIKKISKQISENFETNEEFEKEFKKIIDTDKAFNKRNAKRTLNENEWKKEINALELSDCWIYGTDCTYSINKKNNTLNTITNGVKESLYFKIEKGVPVIELETDDDEIQSIIFNLYK